MSARSILKNQDPNFLHDPVITCQKVPSCDSRLPRGVNFLVHRDRINASGMKSALLDDASSNPAIQFSEDEMKENCSGIQNGVLHLERIEFGEKQVQSRKCARFD